MNEIERVFVRFRGRTIGPFTPDKIKEMVRRGQVTRMHELSGDGLSWMKADTFGNFFPRAASQGAAGDIAATAGDVPPGGSANDGGRTATNDNATAQWYAHVNDEKQGPVSLDQMRLYAEAKILKKDSLVWKAGMPSWKPASETLPELFGQAAKSKNTDVASATGPDAPSDPGPLASEICRNNALVMTLGIGLLLIAVVVLAAQITVLAQRSPLSSTDWMAAIIRIALAAAAGVSGVFALQTAGKLKMAKHATSPIAALVAAKTLSHFWLVAAVASMLWLGILVLVLIAALATGVSPIEVLV